MLKYVETMCMWVWRCIENSIFTTWRFRLASFCCFQETPLPLYKALKTAYTI
jgi:hypothetical protein